MLKVWFQAYQMYNMPYLGNFCEKPLHCRVQIFVWNKSFCNRTIVDTCFNFLKSGIFLNLHFHTFLFESWISNPESWISSQIVFNLKSTTLPMTNFLCASHSLKNLNRTVSFDRNTSFQITNKTNQLGKFGKSLYITWHKLWLRWRNSE